MGVVCTALVISQICLLFVSWSPFSSFSCRMAAASIVSMCTGVPPPKILCVFPLRCYGLPFPPSPAPTSLVYHIYILFSRFLWCGVLRVCVCVCVLFLVYSRVPSSVLFTPSGAMDCQARRRRRIERMGREDGGADAWALPGSAVFHGTESFARLYFYNEPPS